MSKKSYIIYPEIEEEKTAEMMGSKRVQKVGEISFDDLEKQLIYLVNVLDSVDSTSKNYAIDEVNLTVGWAKESSGDIKIGLSAKIFSIIDGKAEGKLAQGITENQLFTLKIKRE